mgnify:FL=1
MDINDKLTTRVQSNYQKELATVLKELISMKQVQVNLHADITFDKLMKGLFKYEYKENDKNIPEDQFGLGYTNLIMIIASIMDYIAKYPKSAFNSHINLISIEEPEVFMHPQMQELFIENINKALGVLLKKNDINVNIQLIISTHSPHILNSKIHSSNSFNNICYITDDNSFDACAINLNNEVVVNRENGDNYKKDISFLKKHIKFKTSELFFSDAVIFVEGFAEELLIPLYIEKLSKLNHRYISVFNINGAHGRVYEKLIHTLKIPTLMITDLDIKRTDEEKDNFIQYQYLDNVETTNLTLSHFIENSELTGITEDFIIKDNLYIAYQGKKINDYYATSFEEAFILHNYKNKILNSVLQNIKPKIYKQIIGNNDYDQNKLNSYKWQVKLSEDKGKFANNLFFEIITAENDEDIPELPEYISNGLKWLESELGQKNV